MAGTESDCWLHKGLISRSNFLSKSPVKSNVNGNKKENWSISPVCVCVRVQPPWYVTNHRLQQEMLSSCLSDSFLWPLVASEPQSRHTHPVGRTPRTPARSTADSAPTPGMGCRCRHTSEQSGGERGVRGRRGEGRGQERGAPGGRRGEGRRRERDEVDGEVSQLEHGISQKKNRSFFQRLFNGPVKR